MSNDLTPASIMFRLANRLALLIALSALAACSKKDVVLYVAVDQEHSEALVQQFAQETGLEVRARYDTEASKTVGLVSALIEERDRPRCDVFWNNELAQTVRLQQLGLLADYRSPSGETLPERWKDPQGYWHAFGARARVILVNTKLLPDRQTWPTSTWDLIDPKWKGRCGVARPLVGTVLTHFTALALGLGEQKFQHLIDGIFTNQVELTQGNGAAMKAVADGRLAWAFTDTDDSNVAISKGHPVTIVFPDQEAGGLGTMLLPNAVAILKNCPHPETAKRLADWLLREQTEGLLAASLSAQIPVRKGVVGPAEKSILPLGQFHEMAWDPAKVAAALEKMSTEFAKRF